MTPPHAVPAPARFLTDLDVRKVRWDGSADQRGTWRTLAPLQYYSAITA